MRNRPAVDASADAQLAIDQRAVYVRSTSPMTVAQQLGQLHL
jgi:hypothetical protein